MQMGCTIFNPVLLCRQEHVCICGMPYWLFTAQIVCEMCWLVICTVEQPDVTAAPCMWRDG